MKYCTLLLLFFTAQIKAQTTIHDAIHDVSDVIVHDVFTAPATSRIYAYCTFAAYEAMAPGFTGFNSFAGKANGMPLMPQPDNKEKIDFEAAGILACYFTAQSFIFSEQLIEEKMDVYIATYQNQYPNKTLEPTIIYAKNIASKIETWSHSDNYISTRPLPRYTLINEPYAWQPTGPDFADANEPYWGKLRPFFIDSTTMHLIDKPLEFSIQKDSPFYNDAFEVYQTTNNLTAEQKQIADFWDDNPYAVTYVGHMQYALKKISPAGHWLNIAGIVLQQQHFSSIQSAYVYALLAATNADAIIACWDAKYTFNLMRPETYIKTYIDPAWQPYLTTPPFPEYSSGHSTVSAASATILTYCIGDNLLFTDSIESAYGIAPRTFNSFHKAAEEAGISRLYGGIHFRTAMQNGAKHGEQIALYIIQKTK